MGRRFAPADRRERLSQLDGFAAAAHRVDYVEY
jgi:hypothetical protein